MFFRLICLPRHSIWRCIHTSAPTGQCECVCESIHPKPTVHVFSLSGTHGKRTFFESQGLLAYSALSTKRNGNYGADNFPFTFISWSSWYDMTQITLKMVVMVGPESWHGWWRTEVAWVSKNHPGDLCSHTAAAAVVAVLCSSLFPGLGFGSTSVLPEVGSLGLFIDGKISCCFIFRATRMENITSGIYDVTSKGKFALAFTYYK